MLKVGITGGIGSGKSIVAKVLNIFGIPVFDADSVSKKIMHENETVKNNIIHNFGNVYPENILDKKALAKIVFSNEKKLQLLNSIVHPATIAYWKDWVKKQEAPYVLKESAILFESGTTEDLDVIIGVYAPKMLRIQRAMTRNQISREEVIERMNKQIDESIKMKLCDIIIVNDDKNMIIPQLLELHENILHNTLNKI